jgi:biopolymer transport protein ExbB/TolQ
MILHVLLWCLLVAAVLILLAIALTNHLLLEANAQRRELRMAVLILRDDIGGAGDGVIPALNQIEALVQELRDSLPAQLDLLTEVRDILRDARPLPLDNPMLPPGG